MTFPSRLQDFPQIVKSSLQNTQISLQGALIFSTHDGVMKTSQHESCAYFFKTLQIHLVSSLEGDHRGHICSRQYVTLQQNNYVCA